jgi:FkbM family methyltransferase
MSDLYKPGGEHTVDLDLIPPAPVVLDVGCRDFMFCSDMLKYFPGSRIIALDPDPSIENPNIDGVTFLRKAVTERDVEGVVWQGPGEGAFICSNPGDPGYGWPQTDPGNSASVPNVTIGQLMEEYRIEFFDLVKLDCEGSEFGILENWPGPIATQLSVEFHDWVNKDRWNDAYFHRLFSGPLKDYEVKLFGLTPLGPGNHMGHWDSLLVLKNV